SGQSGSQISAQRGVSSRSDVPFKGWLLSLNMTLPLRRVGMATTGNLSEEQVHCSICLDVFTNPVSIPCGHNFCQGCIVGYWKTSPLYQCPMCKKSFHKRPDISVNTVLREIAEQFKQIRVKSTEGKGRGEEVVNKTKRWAMERKVKEDEERLLEKNQKQHLMEELKQKQEQRRDKQEAKKIDVTLDPDTANPWLQLSQDRHQVRHLGAWQELPDNPDRFDTVVIVLGRDGFTSGRHYWEVHVGEKDDWYLGVAKSSVKRKGRISVSTTHGYWALAMKKGQGYRVSTSPPLLLSLEPKPKRVGVYVDYEEGQVSFYDIKARTHIYTFEDTFTGKILPFFYLYCCDKASDTMVICPVQEKSLIK
uniref:Si:dkey-46i9.6 n=1 Tax=Cyprinodon variegatus TaxID=28743 RepID=A0A3Q2DD91_CYPVA